MTRRSSDRRPVCLAGRPAEEPRSWDLAGLPLTPRDHRPERLRPPPHPLGVQPARRARADHGPRRHVAPPRLRFARRHRPRRAVRIRRVLPGRDQGGHQADHRRRDLRRPARDDRPRPAGRQPALPPDPAGHRPRRLPQPVPAASPTPTSTASTTSRASTGSTSPATARASSASARASAARSPRRSRRRTGTSPARSPATTATSSARTGSSWSCRTTGCPSSTGSTSSCSGSRPRSGCRWS